MNNNSNNSFELLDFITVFSLCLQLQGYQQDRKQVTANQIMNELNKQDKIYFETIIKNQQKILDSVNAILKEDEKNGL